MTDTVTETIQPEDEARLIRLYHDVMQQMSRAVAQHATSTDAEERLIVGRAIRVLQGRLEGVGLAWYVLHGDREESEDELRSAVEDLRRGR